MGVDLLLQDVPDELAKELLNKDYAEVALRNLKQRFKKFFKLDVKIADKNDKKKDLAEEIHHIIKSKDKNKINDLADNMNQVFNSLKNTQITGILSSALSAAGLVATVVGTIMICDHLNEIDEKLDQLRTDISDHKNMNFETDINMPCRRIVDDYKVLGKKLKDRDPVSEAEMIKMIRDSHDYIITLYKIRKNCSLDTVLNLIFTLLPVYANSIMIYYQRFYDPDRGVHALHQDWMDTFDILSGDDFLNEIQDYMFIDQHQTNFQVNEYLDCHQMILYGYRHKIEELLEDLKECNGVEGYNEAMRWCRQYTEQQAKVVQADLETRYGKEIALEMITPVLEEALA